MTIYKLTGTRNDIFRISFTYGRGWISPAYREKCVGSWDVDDVGYWQEYIRENFETTGNGYYHIPSFHKFMNTIKRGTVEPSLFERFHDLPGLIKFLLIGTIIITGITTYQSLESKQQATEQRQ